MRTSTALSMFAILCVLAGCGDSGGDSRSPQDEVREAARAARDQPLRVRVVRSGTVKGLGVYGMEGEAVVEGRDGSVKGLTDGPDRPLQDPFELRVRGEDVWLTPGPREKLPRGKRWVRVPGDRSIERGLAPYWMLDMFEKAQDVERVGETKVEGAPATHYRALVAAPEMSHVPEIVVMSGRSDRVPVDLYVADGRPKRLRMRYDTGESDMSADLVVLGVSPEGPLGPPPASQTADQR